MVSVVLAVRNEGRYLPSCLAAIAAQDYAADRLEILIVDGGSADQTRQLAADFVALRPAARLLDNPALRAAPGLNLGIRCARGEVIVRVDGHTVIAPDYVRQCVDALRSTGAQVVGGPRVVHGFSFWGRVIASVLASPMASPARFHRSTRVADVDSVFLGAFCRTALERVGYFDERFLWNEDYELNYRIRRAGGRICSTPLLKSTYFPRESLGALGLQFWRYGRGKAMVLQRHPGSIHRRHLVAPVWVLALGGGVGLALLGQPTSLIVLVTVYALVVASVSTRATRGQGVLALAAACIAFACVHLAWGAGVLAQLATDLLNPTRPLRHRFARDI